MNTSPRKLGLCLFVLVTASLTANWQLQAQNKEKSQLAEVFYETEGWIFYQPIQLKNYVLRASEYRNQLEGSTSFMEYEINKDETNHLADFKLVLSNTPSQVIGPFEDGRQSPPLLSTYTVYNDLDGDTILDTMVKLGPKKHESYILYKNSWVRVGSNMMGFAIGRDVSRIGSNESYIFKKHEWELVK